MEELKHWQDWDVVDLIGRGSYGAVYEIERKLFDDTEKAALKVISIPQSDSEIKALRRDGYDDGSITMVFNDQLQGVLKEYKLMRKLNGNTNVVNCDDVQRIQHDDGLGWDIFIKMELLQPMSESLPMVVDDEEVIKFGTDICNALILCNRFNIIHRDIKPQNIFVSPCGDYKLGDFGVARTMERTAGGTKTGTYNYMAPEVYNNQDYNHTVDIYSLGLVLYWLLNERRTPFLPLPPKIAKTTEQEEARYRRFRGEKIEPPKHGSDGLKAVVLKACAFDPKDRFQSAAEMKRALETLDIPVEKSDDLTVVELTKDDEETVRDDYEEILADEESTEEEHRDKETKEESRVEEHIPDKIEKKQKDQSSNGFLKIVLAILVVLSIGLGVFGMITNRDSDTIELNYEVKADDTIVITGLKDEQCTSLRVPPEIEGKAVTEIGDHAFYGCVDLTKITIPETVTTIGDYAFYGCSGLTKITIPETVTTIGDYVFYGCDSLENVVLPGEVTPEVGDAFAERNDEPAATPLETMKPSTDNKKPSTTVTTTSKPTATATPKPTATATPKPTATATPKPTATATPKPTATATPKPTATATPKPAATATPKPAATATPKPTATTPNVDENRTEITFPDSMKPQVTDKIPEITIPDSMLPGIGN